MSSRKSWHSWREEIIFPEGEGVGHDLAHAQKVVSLIRLHACAELGHYVEVLHI